MSHTHYLRPIALADSPQSEDGEAIRLALAGREVNLILLGWAFAVLMKFSQGSATVSMLTTAAMIRLGKVYGNRMVDLQPTNVKLWERAKRIVAETTGASRSEAEKALNLAGRQVKVAIVMLRAGVDAAGGRELPDWSPEGLLQAMADLDVGTAILSVSTPGTTFLPARADAASLARDLNDYSAQLVADRPDRFGFFATVPMPHLDEAVSEAVRALDVLNADGVTLLANSNGTYVGAEGQDPLFAALDERSAVVFIHPAELPGPVVPGVLPFAADFLLDTTRAAYLLVRNGIRRRYPNIRFILSHAGGFVPYASHRMALSIFGDTGASLTDNLDDFASFYFDTALSSSPAALPSLLAFARPGHVTFGSDFPFAPVPASQLFAGELENHPLDAATRAGVDRDNALALFPRLGSAPPPPTPSRIDAVKHMPAADVEAIWNGVDDRDDLYVVQEVIRGEGEPIGRPFWKTTCVHRFRARRFAAPRNDGAVLLRTGKSQSVPVRPQST